MVTGGNEWLQVDTGDSKEEVMILRYTQTDRHFIIIYMSIIINNNIIIIIGSLPPRCSKFLDPSQVLTVIVVLIVIAFKIIIKQYLQLDYWDEAGARDLSVARW